MDCYASGLIRPCFAKASQGILHSLLKASDAKWRRGDSNPRLENCKHLSNNDLDVNQKDKLTKNCQNQPQNCSKGSIQSSQNPVENQAFNLPDDLAAIIEVWPSLPEHIKIAIRALTQAYKTEKK